MIDKTCLIPTLKSTSQKTSVTSKISSITLEMSNQTALTSPDTANSTTPGQLNYDIIESSATSNLTTAAVDQSHSQISTVQEVSSSTSVLDNTPLSSNIQSSPGIDFMSSSHHDHSPRITENILVQANIVPRQLADIFYQPAPTNRVKKKIPRVVVEELFLVKITVIRFNKGWKMLRKRRKRILKEKKTKKGKKERKNNYWKKNYRKENPRKL